MSETQNFRYSVVVPVYNEHEVIAGFCAKAKAGLPPGFELLICYDFEGDSTLSALAAIPADQKPEHIRLVHNTLGKGVRYAIEAGMRAATAPVTLVMMADMSDDPACVEAMISRVEAGADVVCGSRYMKGGQQIGGPWFKKFLSRSAGVSLHYLTGLPTHDPTNSFKAYRTEYLRGATIESKAGFCLGLELTAKAYFAGGRVEEVPSTWTDRSGGESRFRLGKWLPLYLDWYAWTLDKSRRANILFPTLLFAFVLILGVLQLVLQPQRFLLMHYITWEHGNQLWRAEQILHGKMFQRDFACQYEPLGSYLYAGAAAVFGNSPIVCHCWHFAANLLCLMLAYLLVRRAADLLTASIYSFTVLVAVFVANNSCCVNINAEYMPIERALMLGIALSWQPPEQRGVGRNLLVGLLLGMMQWTKFGGAFFSLGAILILDAIWQLKHVETRPKIISRKLIVGYSALFVCFAAIQSLLAAWAYFYLSREIAFDTLWPVYMMDDYANGGGGRWALSAVFASLQYLVGRQLLPLLAAFLGFIGFFQYAFKPARQGSDRGVSAFLYLVFFVLALGSYIGHAFIIFQYLFGPAVAGIWYFRNQSWWFRIGFSLLIIPFASLTILLLVHPPERTDSEWVEVSPGQKLYVAKSMKKDIDRMPQFQSSDPSRFLFFVGGWGGGGFHYYFNPQYPLRNTFIVRAGFRTYDVEELMKSVDRISGVLVDVELREPSLEKILAPIIGEGSAREFAGKFSDRVEDDGGYYHYFPKK